MTDAELIELQKTIYTSRNPTRRWLHCTRRDLIKATLKKYAPNKLHRILEIGPGSGVYISTLTSLFQNVVAIDINWFYLKHVKTNLVAYPNLSLVAQDVGQFGFLNGSFDMILCSEVIEHICNSQKVFFEMHNLLKPKGLLILSTPYRYSAIEILGKILFIPVLFNLAKLLYKEPLYRKSGHINLMTEKQITKQLNEAGFKIREHFRSGLYIPIIAELAGKCGLKCEQILESKLAKSKIFNWMFWTHYYVCEA